MVLPSFIIGGAAKAGTTVLHAYLSQHPQVFMSKPKEPRYFAFCGKRPDFQGPEDEELFNSQTVYEKEHYHALFDDAEGFAAVGEASPVYLHLPGCAKAIHDELPTVKLIFILRHPVELMFSAYMHQVRRGRETLPLEQALLAESERTKANWVWGWRYKQLGFVSERVTDYIKIFPRDQLMFIKYDDFWQDNSKILREICRFIEVDESYAFRPARENVGGRHKNAFIKNLIVRQDHWLKRSMRPILPQYVRRAILSKLKKANIERERLSDHQYKLLLPTYAEEIRSLESLTELDLRDWLSVERSRCE